MDSDYWRYTQDSSSGEGNRKQGGLPQKFLFKNTAPSPEHILARVLTLYILLWSSLYQFKDIPIQKRIPNVATIECLTFLTVAPGFGAS